MKRNFNKLRMSGVVAYLALAAGILQPLQALPASIELATAPLANSTTTTVLPNLMFIMDSSGSMDFNYLPDWVDDDICKNIDGDYDRDCVNSPLFQSPDVNGVYYNPDIRYTAPVKFDGTSYPDQASWTAVKNDAYGVQSTGTTNLVTSYVDVEWCTTVRDGSDNYTYVDCLRNDNYILPGTVNGKAYTVMRGEWCTNTDYTRCLPQNSTGNLPGNVGGRNYTVFRNLAVASGSGSVATGSPSSPTTASRTWGPHYYRINAGEWCDSAKLVNCQATQSTTFNHRALIRWCTNGTNASAATPAANSCQGLRAGSYKTIRFPTRYSVPAQAAVPAVAASASFTISTNGCNNSKKVGIASVTVNGNNILASAPTGTYSSASDLANAIRQKGATSGYSFAGSGSTLIVRAPVSAGNVTSIIGLTRTSGSNSACTFTLNPAPPQLGGYIAAVPAVPADFTGSFTRTDIVSGGTYAKGAGRTDCAADPCTYTEEMTNFANWWTYYQTRMQTMKTSTSLAFKKINNRYRVGFIDIYGRSYLPIAPFEAGTGNTKDLWYTQLFAMNPSGGTPLRSALSRVGRIFAGQKPVGTADPMQYSCQQNFALLTTDGYWNGDTETVRINNNNVTRTIDVNGLDGNLVDNRDGGSTPRPMFEGPTASSNSLADVAKYYFDTDLRTPALGNCDGADGSGGSEVCENNVFQSDTDNNVKQHMTTFTLGLGVDGSLTYVSDYKAISSGDYYNIIHGTGSSAVNWPVPVADTETAVDDLWHAAVNGQGTYFSAKDPTQLASGINGALASIGSKLGAGSAAATSSLNPVAGDNFAYVASYTTGKWKGNLEARTINLVTGSVSEAPTWCVEDTVDADCGSPSSITSTVTGNSTSYFCSTPGATADTCVGGTLEGTICHVEVPRACTGTMRAKVGATNDTRTIKMSNSNHTALVDFTYDNLSTTQKTYFSGTELSQWAELSADQKLVAAGTNMVSYLRGQTGFEERSSNALIARLYKYREATLGDITESQPVFVGKPAFKYTDPGYAQFATDNASRPKTVYVGANDGMLHAFNAVDGTERWAFVPTAVIPKLWRLADKNYGTMHTNYVNGAPIIADVYDPAGAGRWRTILVAGLNGGGRGYYALDVTDPTAPSLLWEIDSSTAAEDDVGYGYGYPVITKRNDGKWVVLFTSGYNNTSPGDGKGYLYIRDALTGAVAKNAAGDDIPPIGTGVGDGTTPSGLAKISNYGNDPMRNNTSVVVYGGDLQGNVWRFDINAGTVLKFAVLKDRFGNLQPITAAPELGLAYGKRIVFIGTGKYLEKADLNIDVNNPRPQTIYAIKDNDTVATIADPRAILVQQTLTTDGGTRTSSDNAVNLRTGSGWFIDFPDAGERVNIDPKLDAGLLIAPTTVPSDTVCAPGGYGWLNYFNYLVGNNNENIVSQKFDAPIVGVNIYYTPDGKRHFGVVTSKDPTPREPEELPPPPNPLSFQGKRVIWRELIP